MPSAPPPPDWPDRQSAAATLAIGQPAGFWLRVWASLIDGVIVGIPVLVVIGALVAVFYDASEEDTGFIVVICLLAALVVAVGCWLYESLLTSSPRGATLGKQAIGLRVLHEDGGRLGFGRATGRYFAKTMISASIPLGIGYLMAGFTERKRALHDFIASTVVVRNRSTGQTGRLAMATVPASGPAAPPPPVWDARPAGPATTGYGGFWIRVVAYIIDAIILGVASSVIGLVSGNNPFAPDLDAAFDYTGTSLSLVIGWLYFALLESSERGATVGKMALGLRVVTERGERLSFLHATGRYFAKFISGIILGIGFIMVGFTDRKRGLHDMIAGTLVIKQR